MFLVCLYFILYCAVLYSIRVVLYCTILLWPALNKSEETWSSYCCSNMSCVNDHLPYQHSHCSLAGVCMYGHMFDDIYWPDRLYIYRSPPLCRWRLACHNSSKKRRQTNPECICLKPKKNLQPTYSVHGVSCANPTLL